MCVVAQFPDKVHDICNVPPKRYDTAPSIFAIIMRQQLIHRYDDCRVPTSVCGGLSEVSAREGILEVKGQIHYVITTHTCIHR